jgi:arylsulfatase
MLRTLLTLSILTYAVLAQAERPNIVLIIADDMGYSDLGCYGGEIETPTLDQLASTGIRFTNYYVQNMCWPTRASLLTSLYPKTALAAGSASQGFRSNALLLPEALREAGYKSYMTGKWHLSDPEKPNGPSAPHKRGFDRTYATYHGTTDFFAPADLNENGEDRTYEWKDNPDFYYTDAITDYSIKFLKEHPKENPFFIYVSYNAAHWPLHAKPEDIEHYKGRFSEGWDKLRTRRHAGMKKLGVVDPSWEISPRNPQVPAWRDEEHPAWQERRMEVYAAQITCMDRNIARIVKQVKESGQQDNTIFLYQHDNGGCHVEYTPERTGSWTKPITTDGKKTPIIPGNLPHIMPGPQSTWQSYGYGWANLSNTPFRLFKQHDHEGGTRSPLIMSWPAGIQKSLAGGVSNELIHVIDMMPTLLDLAGLSPESLAGKLPFEGNSFLSVLKGAPQNWQPHNELYWEHSKGKAARIDGWKLVSENRKPWELYHINQDGTELNNLAADMPEKVAELERKHSEWDKRTNLRTKQ